MNASDMLMSDAAIIILAVNGVQWTSNANRKPIFVTFT